MFLDGDARTFKKSFYMWDIRIRTYVTCAGTRVEKERRTLTFLSPQKRHEKKQKEMQDGGRE